MDSASLKPGLYVLGADVTNPRPDRRYKRAFPYQPVWKAGTLLCLRPLLTPDAGVNGAYIWGDSVVNAIYKGDHPGWPALVAALSPAPSNPLAEMLFERRLEREWGGPGWYGVLRKLHAQGKLDVEALATCLDEWLNEPVDGDPEV